MRHVSRAKARPLADIRALAVLPAVFAAILGFFILYGVGFAGSATIHNAAHDARHAFAFPCH